MRLHGTGTLALGAVASLASGPATSSYAQEWRDAVAQGIYAVYAENRRTDGPAEAAADTAEYFIQTFNTDGTVTITNYVLKAPPSVEGGALHTLAEALCDGAYTPVPGGQHEATCGDDTYALLIRRTEMIDGVLVATEMRGMNTARGTEAGEVYEYIYRRLPDGWENARIQGTYAGYQDAPRGGLFDIARYFIVSAPVEGPVIWHQAVTNTQAETAGTRTIELAPDFITRNYQPNGRFPGIHQALNTETGAPTFDWLILDAETINGVMVATEYRGFAVGAGSPQWHYIRIGDPG